MHQYLRTWRKHRKLTLEKVGAHLGVKHTTVGRWEKGELPVNSENLAKMAELYRASELQLVGGPPTEADMVKMIDEVQSILAGLDPEDRSHWLATGRALARNAKAPDARAVNKETEAPN